jgi:hypothetical protein
MTGGLGVIPEPTVKVRMRENQREAVATFAIRRLRLLFHPEMRHQISLKGVEDEPDI